MSNIQTVQAIYQAFGAGDVPAILKHLSEGVEWEYGGSFTDVPWLQPQQGRAAVGGFFAALAALEFRNFAPRTLAESGATVIALIALEATVRATGRRIVEVDETHIWHFDSHGLVVKFRHRVDSHQHWLAYHGTDAHR